MISVDNNGMIIGVIKMNDGCELEIHKDVTIEGIIKLPTGEKNYIFSDGTMRHYTQ